MLRNPGPTTFVAIGLAAASAPAHADPATDDLHCYMVSMQLQQAATEPAARNAAMMGSMYWQGKLVGREPGLDLEQRIVEETPRLLDTAYFQAEGRRCAAEMNARAQSNMALGQRLKERGQQGNSGR